LETTLGRQEFLAIRCEIGPDDLTDDHRRQTREHIADRTYSPGFPGIRLFTSEEAITN
jgi:hypothetical protein